MRLGRRSVFTLGTLSVLLVSAALVGRFGAGGAAAPAADSGGAPGAPWNIVVIVIDTARQDRLSCYGYERETSPRLSELAESATLYTNAYSTSSWTGPGHASLFTGLYSAAHGATQENWALSDSLVTFAEVLAKRGYRTVGIAENPMLASDRGYAQGFSEYYESWRRGSRGSSGACVEDFRRALDGAPGVEPFLVFVNIIAPHSPYDSAKQFRDRFVSDPSIRLSSNMWRQYYTGRRSFSAAELKHLNELYDAEMLYADYLVGQMMDELGKRGLWDRTVFVVTSDHGENIGDHSHVDHVFTLYETATRIPLIVRQPAVFRAGGVDTAPVQLTDLFPTFLELAGLSPSDFPSQGRSLLDEGAAADRPVFMEYYYPRQVLSCYGREEFRRSPLLTPYLRRIRSVTKSGMKLIWGSDGRHELYDIANDPHETRNLIDSPAHREIRDELIALVQKTYEDLRVARAAATPPAEDELDEATKEALRSLGYLE